MLKTYTDLINYLITQGSDVCFIVGVSRVQYTLRLYIGFDQHFHTV